MKYTIKTYKYEKVEVSDTEIEIPEEPLYVFQTGIRRAIRIIPVYTFWQKEKQGIEEEIYKLEVTCAYAMEDKVEMFEIHVRDLETMVNNEKDSYNIGRMLLHKDYNTRTEEKFNEDLKRVLDKINHVEND